MCDIYMHKCSKCDIEFDMHLADFDTGRDEVEVFCENHMPENRNDGVLWTYDDDCAVVNGEFAKAGGKVFIRSLTDNAKRNWEGNHPNSITEKAIEVFGKKTKR